MQSRRGQDGVLLLGQIRSLKWIARPGSPVSSLDDFAAELGLGSLYVKRDDLLPALAGGTAARKLDYLLASAPFDTAPGFHGVGGAGSDFLAALATACHALGKTLHAHVFGTPSDGDMLDNLAVVSSEAQSVHFFSSRAALRLRQPALMRAGTLAHLPILPLDATSAAGIVGLVYAGLELGEQIHGGELPEPTRIYVPLATGGTAVGLAIGLALARVPTHIHAVASGDGPEASETRLTALTQQALAWLTKAGISGTSSLKPIPIIVDRRRALVSAAPVERMRHAGIDMADRAGARALAALVSDAPGIGKRPVLFWHTRRGALPPIRGDWRWRLPEPLRRRLPLV